MAFKVIDYLKGLKHDCVYSKFKIRFLKVKNLDVNYFLKEQI